VTEPVRPEDMRASDADRKAVQEKLHAAHEQGLIDLAEFDDRVRAAWQAKTRGELAKVTADLPERLPAKPSRSAGEVAMRVLTTVWLSLSAVNFVIWGLVCLVVEEFIHPWWVWVFLPPGSVLGVLWFMGIGRPRKD